MTLEKQLVGPIAGSGQPHLRSLNDGRDHHASWMELFFDLVFVFTIAELSHHLEAHLSFSGFLEFALLFIPCWWAWVMFTFYADRFETDDLPHRLLMLSGMLAILCLGVNIHGAFAESFAGFALSYVAARSIVLLLYWRAAQFIPSTRANLKLFLASYLPSTVLWLLSIWVGQPNCYVLWVLAIAIELVLPIAGSRILSGTPSHPSHLRERFGLFTLIVLGESIVTVAAGTAESNWQLPACLAAIGGFVIAACLWWLYFSFLENSVMIHDVRSVHIYNYGHLPIFMGLALVAVGTSHLIAADGATLAAEIRWTLCGGIALYMLAIALIWVLTCGHRISSTFLMVVGGAIALAVWGGALPPLLLLGVLVAMMVFKVMLNIRSNRQRSSSFSLPPD